MDVELTDLVPDYVTADLELPNFSQAVKDIHHPKPGSDVLAYSKRTTATWQRLKLDELLAQQITLIYGRKRRRSADAPPLLGTTADFTERFSASLPFELTAAQKHSVEEIARDLAASHPMHRLLQGDVGCGKTIVAAFACLKAIDSGFQAALMAPTEILAEQHYQKLHAWFAPIGLRVLWLAGSLKPKDKAAAQLAVREGRVDLIVGTHAIIQEAVQFARLGLAVVDEQHRFGVAQRLKLRAQGVAGRVPHMLMLSATPIPRTLAMSYLADIDISVIDELPRGRSPIVTKLVSLARIREVIAAIGNAVCSKRQCYWVCPLIEESEKAQLTAATLRFE